jgi:hypothetical protein
MKTSIKQLFMYVILITSAHFTSCSLLKEESDVSPNCSDYGYLKVTNGSTNTIQVIIIDGTRYGSLTPGETETFKLPVGRHNYEFSSANGRGGCSPATVTIVGCGTESRECRG